MTKVAILPEQSEQGKIMYRAVAGARQAVAKTAGGALDALAAQLPPEESGTLVVVQNHRSDRFFTREQQERLETLMQRWRTARDTGKSLSSEEEAELKQLVDAEVQASGQRAAAALAGLER
jgi:DNA-binding IclR family transcriptional regulator